MTNFIKQKFQWFFDMATSTDYCQVVEIKAGGEDIVKRLAPFFNAFKNYKLGSVSIRMVPAATLPVDPTGLSYEAGESTVDPRDIFNPGLVRITNGEDNKLTEGANPFDPIHQWTSNEATYYATMLDPRWYKFRLQNGFKRTATPRFWGIGQVHQDMYPGNHTNIPWLDSNFQEVIGAATVLDVGYGDSAAELATTPNLIAGSSQQGLFQTGQKIRMGWLPTQNLVYTATTQQGGINNCPEIPLITCILPKAYKTKFYYRVYVTETVMFKDPVAINPYEASSQLYAPVDVMVGSIKNTSIPTSGVNVSSVDLMTNKNNGAGANGQ